MKNLYIYALIMLLRQTHVIGEEPCGEQNITGAVGGAVTLHFGHTGVKSISWSVGERDGAFVTTYQGQTPDVLEEQYEGRLSSTSDGSLIITNLKQEDRGTYQAKYRKDGIPQKCSYHLTLFSNLTDKDVIITPNVTNNKTCEVTLTCSVNGSDVTTTWKSLNVSDIDRTQNVVFVSPSYINFTYICTAKNPVSEASKVVHPREYCRRGDTTSSSLRMNQAILIGAAACFLLILALYVYFITVKRKKRRCKRRNKKKPSTETNAYELRDECCTVYSQTLGDKEQKPEMGRLKKNKKDKQESPMCSAATVYSQSHHSTTMEPQKSSPMENTSTTLYSTVQHAKDKNSQKISAKAPNGDVPKPSAESCYEFVQLPKETNGQMTSSEGANADLLKVESCYAQVQLSTENSGQKIRPKPEAVQKPPRGAAQSKDSNGQKTSTQKANGDPSKASVDSYYAEVQLPTENSGQKIPPKPVNAKPPEAAQKPSQKLGKPPQENSGQKIPPKPGNAKPPEVVQKSFPNVEKPPKENSGQKIPPKPVNVKPPEAVQKPSQKVGKLPKDENNQIDPPITVNGIPLKIAQKPPDKVVESPKDANGQTTSFQEGDRRSPDVTHKAPHKVVKSSKPTEPSKDDEPMYDNVQGVEVKSRIQ